MSDLANKVALITGASRGIGRATALAMAQAGARVAVAARTEPQLRALSDEVEAATGKPALVCVADVSNEADVVRMVEATLEAFGRVDVLINNAGFNARKCKIWEITTAEWDAMFGVNLRGAFLCCREVVPGMIERRSGHIINVISTAAQIGLEQIGVYGATKWGLLGLTKSLIKEARPYNIRVTALSPGGTDTSFRAEARPQRGGQQRQASGGSDDGKARQFEPDGAGAGSLADNKVEGKVLHCGIQYLFDGAAQPMHLVDEEHLLLPQVAQDGSQVALTLDGWPRGDADGHVHLVGDAVGQCRLAQSRRPVQKHVIQRFAALFGGFNEDTEVFPHAILTD